MTLAPDGSMGPGNVIQFLFCKKYPNQQLPKLEKESDQIQNPQNFRKKLMYD